MGFGSGGGGFTPSPNNVPGSTTTGTDKDTDTHQFTGSVDITGSLTLNGSSITGGGGGGTPGGSDTQVQYNDAGSFAGSSNLVFDGTTLTANQITGSTHISTPKLGVNTPVGAQSLFVIGETRLQGTTYASHIPLASGAQSIFLRPGTATGDVVLADSAATQNVGVGTSTPTAKLHVSSSGGEPLFRVDQDTQTGAKPILFITGSGLVGIGTAAPRTDSADTNRVHIMGEGGADQGQNPIPNALLMLENNGPAGIQFMTPGSPTSNAGIIAWGGPANNRLANLYYTDADNRYTFEGPGFGNKRVMTLRASGDSMNVGASNSGHMITAEAALHISSSTGGTGTGGPVLLKVDHANAANVLFVTGSGRVGIGTATPTQALDVAGTANATTLSIGGTAIASTAAELNLLDAGATQHTASVLAAIPKLLKATYDFADQGGGAQTHTLTGSISLQIPDNAMIVGGWVDTETNPAPTAGTPTISFGMTAGSQTTIFLAATNYNEFASAAGGSLIPVIQATPVQYFKMPSASTITCTIASNTLTAGKLHIYLQYVVGA